MKDADSCDERRAQLPASRMREVSGRADGGGLVISRYLHRPCLTQPRWRNWTSLMVVLVIPYSITILHCDLD